MLPFRESYITVYDGGARFFTSSLFRAYFRRTGHRRAERALLLHLPSRFYHPSSRVGGVVRATTLPHTACLRHLRHNTQKRRKRSLPTYTQHERNAKRSENHHTADAPSNVLNSTFFISLSRREWMPPKQQPGEEKKTRARRGQRREFSKKWKPA